MVAMVEAIPLLSQCLSLEVQEIVSTEHHQTFNELMTWLCTMFGEEHHVTERTNDLLYFRTTVDEGSADILLRWRKEKCALKLELDYAAKCKVPARKMLKPSDERLMGTLIDSLNGLVRKLVYEQNPTTLEETEEALSFTQNRFKEEIQSRNRKYNGQKNKVSIVMKSNSDNTKFNNNRITLNKEATTKYWKTYYNTKQATIQQSNGQFSKSYPKNKQTKKHWNNECWRCGKHGHKQRGCPGDKKEIQVIEHHIENQENVEHILPMLGLDKVMEGPNAIEIDVDTKEIGRIKAIADTVRKLLTKDARAFNVAHAGGYMTLQDKLKLTLCDSNHIPAFQEDSYVVANLLHNFILSRSVLRKLGYSLKLEHEKFEHVHSDDALDGQDLESLPDIGTNAASNVDNLRNNDRLVDNKNI
ncbi:hypothetical protein RFI_34197 [Reticulomyxa filosa]|uniref:CCHC-type domain-containing protein n=1 Tax=Reticulomyxa filosa TaxID=46433 RepID=X6LNL5_RETFI|nr:hypothetical protein RFI_34197 [Reticulomyxa filosa]|eukprot:ETO03214.1 hypothetical protein RFI_34197 [Reticulomyxa filosa]